MKLKTAKLPWQCSFNFCWKFFKNAYDSNVFVFVHNILGNACSEVGKLTSRALFEVCANDKSSPFRAKSQPFWAKSLTTTLEEFENASLFRSTGRPTVHTIRARKQSFSRTVYKPEEFENDDLSSFGRKTIEIGASRKRCGLYNNETSLAESFQIQNDRCPVVDGKHLTRFQSESLGFC